MIDDPNLPPAAIEDDAAAQPSAAEPVKSVRLNGNAEDLERDALTPADFAAAGVQAPDWVNDPFPSMDTWREWRAAENAVIAFKRAQAAKA